jgi:hypothetical protein
MECADGPVRFEKAMWTFSWSQVTSGYSNEHHGHDRCRACHSSNKCNYLSRENILAHSWRVLIHPEHADATERKLVHVNFLKKKATIANEGAF